ncbi:sensor histidine kinase [Mucilaginibacter sp. JRF]|nr:sensor histidine kinase [Mucilaginibacter sp. JRF]
MLVNLLTNALRYAPDSKRIEIHLIAEADRVRVGVKDFGVGIAPEKLNHIFFPLLPGR